MLTVLFLVERIRREKLFFKSTSLHCPHVWKICILKKQVMEVILVDWFAKCQSIKKVGGRRFVEGLYQALFLFCLARRNVIYKAKRKLSLISGYPGEGFMTGSGTCKFPYINLCNFSLILTMTNLSRERILRVSSGIPNTEKQMKSLIHNCSPQMKEL